MHPPELDQIRRIEHEGQIRLAPDVCISRKARVRRCRMGRAERFKTRAALRRFAGRQRRPAFTIDSIKQMHHVDAAVEFHGRKGRHG
jgi:hypothetical protein